MNDVKLQEGHPLDSNLRPLKIGGKSSSLELSQHENGSGARVTGDLEVTGNLSVNKFTDLIIDDIIMDDLICDSIEVDNITINGETISSSGDIFIDMGDGERLEFQDDSDKFLTLECGSDIPTMKLYASPGGTDYLQIYAWTNGSSWIQTVDAAGQDGHLNLIADGNLVLDSYGSTSIAEASSKVITMTPGTKVHIDKNLSHTTAHNITALHVDVDRTGDVSTGTERATGIDVDVNHTGASGGTIDSIGIDMDVVGDSGGTSTATGLSIDVSGADTCSGIYIDNKNGGTDFKNVSSASAGDYFTINTIADGETTLTTNELGLGTTAHLNMDANGDFTVDASGDISLDSASGNFIAKKSGTEFSAENSSYAGMLLGYTRIQNDDTDVGDNIITVDTTMTVLETVAGTECKVTFIAPPSESVEIQFSCQQIAGRFAYYSLSSAASYAEVDETHTYDDTGIKHDETDAGLTNISFSIVSGLTAGTSYTRWIAAKSNATTFNIQHGRASTTGTHDPPIIIKAIALPATIVTGE